MVAVQQELPCQRLLQGTTALLLKALRGSLPLPCRAVLQGESTSLPHQFSSKTLILGASIE
jgi:hypothetical protein